MRDRGGRGRKESERQGREGKGGGRGREERGGQGKEERGGQALNRLPLLHPFHPHAQQAAQHSTAHTVSSPPAAQ